MQTERIYLFYKSECWHDNCTRFSEVNKKYKVSLAVSKLGREQRERKREREEEKERERERERKAVAPKPYS